MGEEEGEEEEEDALNIVFRPSAHDREAARKRQAGIASVLLADGRHDVAIRELPPSGAAGGAAAPEAAGGRIVLPVVRELPSAKGRV